MTRRILAAAVVLFSLQRIDSPHLGAAGATSYMQIENAKAGTADWRLTNPGFASGAIEGYASLTSVNRGGRIQFFVNTADPAYTLEIFRIGYYQGLGGRRMTAPVTLAGVRQPMPAPDPVTGLIECQWTNPYTLDIPADPDPTVWMSGFYYVKLTGSSGRQQYIHFVVRDDGRTSDLLLAETVATAQAYNVWGGKSLYGTIANRGDTANDAHKVSFDRPYYGDETFGAGNFSDQNDFAVFEWGMVQFLEQNGYDVAYATGLDVDRDANLLLGHRAFLSVGHDEYWSWPMRDHVEQARDAGVNLGFFSANTSYWQVRFENAVSTNAPMRVMAGYKEACLDDPITPDRFKTCRFREAPVNRPEDAMLGVLYVTQGRMPFVVEDASHWIFTGTGLKNGDTLTNPDGSLFIGYEVDAMGAQTPAGAQRVAHSPADASRANFADTVVYRAPSGATVFASGSILWTYRVPQIVQMTRNVLARLIDNAFADADPVRPPLPSPWQAADIGDVGRAGFVAAAGADSFTLNGGGQDSFGGADALYYVSQPFSGDVTITARVTALQEFWDNRAGLMLRESMAPHARYAAIVSRPSGSRMNGTSGLNEGAEFRVKSAVGARPRTLAGVDVRMPNWLRLSRAGDVVYAYTSVDGAAWTFLGSQTVAMGSAVFAGASVSSSRHGVWATASFDHVSVQAGSFVTADALPPGWSHQDVGAVGVAGSATLAGSTFTLRGAGADVWGTADAFHYAYARLSGDGLIVARVATITAGPSWIKAGVMMRASLDPASPHAFMLASYTKGTSFQRRTAAGGASTSTAGGTWQAPRWVKLERSGNTITASQSADGTAWTVVGTDTIEMSTEILVGLVVSSHTIASAATATFDGVTVGQTPPPPPPTGLPSGWSNGDIGVVGAAGTSTYDSTAQVFTVAGAGADVWGTADAFQFAYARLSGDGRIVARVASISAGAAWVKAGVMIRSTLDASSAHGFMLISYAKGAAFQRRTANGGISTSSSGGALQAPRWVRLDRAGSTLTASESADGVTWTTVGSDTIALGPDVYAGIAVSSHTTGATATATFDHVAVTAAAPPPPPGGEACPSVTLDRTSFYSGAPASNWSISLTAPSETCTWTVTIDQPWLTLAGSPGLTSISGTGSGGIQVGTVANTTGAMRTGHFTVAGATYTVTQEF